MSIFVKSDGSKAIKKSTYSSGGFDNRIIPNGTKVLCNVMSVDECENSEQSNKYTEQGPSFLKISLIIVEGEYANKTLNQRAYINAIDDTILDKCVDLVGAYDEICGGKIEKSTAKLRSISQLTDTLLARCINGLSVMVTVGLIEPDPKNNQRAINFVSAIGPPSLKIQNEDKKIIEREPGEDDVFDDDVPF